MSHINHKSKLSYRYSKKHYTNDIDEKIIWVMQLLAENTNILYEEIERYTFSTIRDFLNWNDEDVESVCNLICSDIKWRKVNLPLDIGCLSKVLTSERIYIYGVDKDLNPWVYFRPNAKFGMHFPRNTQIGFNDYKNYLVYCFENLGKLLMDKGYNTTFTMLIDFGGKQVNLDMLDKIYELMAEHYPMKLTWIHLVNAKLK